MSLTGMLLGLTGGKILEKIGKKDFVNNTINKLSEKSAKVEGMKLKNEYKNKEGKKYMYFKIPSASVGTMINVFKNPYKAIEKYGSKYQFCDLSGKIKYLSDYDVSLILDRGTVIIYDKEKNKVGKVKEYAISVGVPLLEKEVKKCSVYEGDNHLCNLKKYIDFGDLVFDTLEGKMHLSCNDEKKHKFKIKKGNKVIATLNELPSKFVDDLVEHYRIEYENKEDEHLIVLMTCALYVLMSS